MGALRGVDMIMHAGDILEMSVIEQLSTIAPTVAVRGNMDHGDVVRKCPESRVIDAESQQPIVREGAQELVHALTGGPDHRGEVALGERCVESDGAVGGRRALAGREMAQPGRQATRDVEEMQLLDVGREPAQLSREGGEECVAQRGLGRDELAEAAPGQGQGLRRLECDRGRRPGGPVEQGQLTEERAGVDRRDDRLVTLLGRQADLDRAGRDDEQRVAGVALVEEHLAAPEPAAAHLARQADQVVLAQAREQRTTGQGHDHRVPIAGAGFHPFIVRGGSTRRLRKKTRASDEAAVVGWQTARASSRGCPSTGILGDDRPMTYPSRSALFPCA